MKQPVIGVVYNHAVNSNRIKNQFLYVFFSPYFQKAFFMFFKKQAKLNSNSYPWGYVFKRAGAGFIAGVLITNPPPHLDDMTNLIGYKVVGGILYFFVVGVAVGVYKIFKRN